MRKYCNTLFALFGFFALTVFSSCATTSMVDDSTLFGRVFSSDSNERQIHLFDSSSNEAITISSNDTDSGFTTWECEDYGFGGKTLIEFGYFSLGETTYGFVLYDGGDEGEITHYSRQGLDRRWDWGENGQYSFVITPDGNGRYYDFTNVPAGESTKPAGIYKAYKR